MKENQCVKNLEVLFHCHLGWDAHVRDTVHKCIGLLIGLRHLRAFLLRRTMLSVVKALVISRVRDQLPS